MAITQNDLEILKSEIMADTPDGGGLPTGIAVIDGVSNNLFPDVSDIDRLLGRVRLRKVSLAVKTANAELLQATRMLFTELPDNPNISVFAFKATSFADQRSDAQNKIESYLTFGSRWSGHVLETQLEGQRVIQISLNSTDDVPKVGKALVLVQNEGQSDEFYQYLRPTNVDTAMRSFTRNTNGSVTSVSRTVATIEFGEALRYTFNGLTVSEFYNNSSTARRAVLREAQVSDAAKYYSASRLSEPVTAMSTRQVRLNSVYVQVVPSSTTETPLPLIDPVGQSSTLVRASDGTISINKSVSVSSTTPWQIGSTIYPSSMSLTISGITMTDVDGELKDSSGNIYASVDYSSGLVTWYNTANFGIQTVVGSFAPASSLMRVMQSEIIYTPESSVGTSYLRQLQAKPSPSSMRVSFQVGGNVTTIRDDGRGNLINDDGTAYGILDYENSLVQLVLPAIPDSESAIIFTYSTDLGTVSVGGQTIKGGFEFAAGAYLPPNFTITWGSKTATVTGSVISGDATGTFDGSVIRITPNTLPAPNTVFTITYDKPVNDSQVKKGDITVPFSSKNTFKFNIGKVDAGKFNARFQVKQGNWVTDSFEYVKLPEWGFTIKDDGAGNIVKIANNGASPNTWTKTSKDLVFDISGTINYATGDVTIFFGATAELIDVVAKIRKDPAFKYFKYIDAKVVSYSNKYTPVTADATEIDVIYSATEDLSGITTETLTRNATELKLTIPDSNGAPVLSGSVSLLSAKDINGSMTVDGVTVGSIEYTTGNVTLTSWAQVANNINVDSAVREFAVPALSSIAFRTASAPIKINTFSIHLKAGGTTYQLQADEDGVFDQAVAYDGFLGNDILTNGITGFIDYQTGVVALYGNNIDPESVTYTGMAYSYLPLDKDLIGLDPVRLPTDGRVPFVRKGDSIAITELKTMALPTNAPNDTFDLGFERLSDVGVVDANGLKVSFDYLDVDLDAGTLTLNSMFDMSFYTAPLTAKYRIMDIALVIETDISGRVTLSTPITHDYSTSAVFSSMLLAGDMQARAYNVISQKSWTSVFSDTLIGDKATSQLQVTNNPIVVTNRDAIEERWALVFTSQTAFNIIGQTVGQIGSGSTTTLTAPINPMTGYPYFTIPIAAWGLGWSANNVVRINTAAAKYPVWIGNAIQQHQGSSSDNYDFTIGYHANIDRDRVVS
jgi:hypothetical protein